MKLGIPSITLFARDAKATGKAQIIVQFFYYGLLALAIWQMMNADRYLYLNTDDFSPIGPVFWMRLLPYQHAVYLVLSIFLTFSLVAATCFRYRFGRVFGFLAVLQFSAYDSSFGHPSHLWYLWLYGAFWFLFLPKTWNIKSQTTPDRRIFLLVIWSSQALVLLTYSMSGFHKVIGAIYQISKGEIHAFSPLAFALHVADTMVTVKQPDNIVGNIFLQYPLAGWPLMLIGEYMLFFSFFVVIRPSLQKLWGIGLILFHIINDMVFRISFYQSPILLAILFFDSPFVRDGITLNDIIADLPIFGWMWRVTVMKKFKR